MEACSGVSTEAESWLVAVRAGVTESSSQSDSLSSAVGPRYAADMNELHPRPRALFAAVAVCALAWLLTAGIYRAPAAKPLDAPDTVFSATRALDAVRRVMQEPDGACLPHPTGSAAHERVLVRLLNELQALGYQPELQDAWSASRNQGVCARLRNVLVEIPGTSPDSGLVMLLAHYDSVPAGPGAADDAAGVAVLLELARQLKLRPPPVSVLLLLSDGEEVGLLGAQLFVEHHPRAPEVEVVLNFEARGSRGPSLMFETFGPTRALVGALAAAPRLLSNSLARTVYARLPNDTDLTVFGQAGYAGLNFAFIDGIEHYHTPWDAFAQLDPGSLQHHGSYAESFLYGLSPGARPWRAPVEAEPVFFDLYGQGLVVLPALWMPWLAGLSLVGLVVAGVVLVRRSRLRIGSLLWGMLAWPLALLLSIAAGWGYCHALTGLAAVPSRVPWVAYPFPLLLGMFGAVGVGLLLTALLLGRRAGFWGAWAGTWLLAAGMSLALAISLAPASYVLVLPVVAAAVASALVAFRPGWRTAATLLPLAVATLLQTPLAWLLADALGVGSFSPLAALLALLSGWLLPWLACLSKRAVGRLLGAALIAALVGGTSAWLLGPYSREHPQRLNLVHQQWTALDGTRDAAWRVASYGEALPVEIAAVARFDSTPSYAPWLLDAGRAYRAPVDPIPGLEPPRLVDVRTEWVPEGRRIRARLISPRGAAVCQLGWLRGAPVAEVRVQGQLLRNLRGLGSHVGFVCPTTPAVGVQIELLLRGVDPLQLQLGDQSAGLPAAAQRLQDARPATSCPSQLGDRTLCLRVVEL